MCQKCGKWTIKNANFCHHCGFNLSGQFFALDGEANLKARPGQAIGQWQSILSEGIIMAGLGAGVAIVAPDYPRIAMGLSVPLVAYALPRILPAMVAGIVDFKSGLFGEPVQGDSGISGVLSVEFTERYTESDKILILDFEFPQGITINHLAHIHQQIAQGKTFARRALCEAGKLSQGEFYTIRDALIHNHFLFYRNPAVPNMGLVLTPRGRKLLKKSFEMWEKTL